MSINDPLGDMLTRIRNAQLRRRPKVVTPASNIRGRVLDVLAEEGYIRGYTRVGEELRGISASLMRAAKRSSAGRLRSLAIAFRRFRFSACCAASLRRMLFFSTELVLAMYVLQRPFGISPRSSSSEMES